MMGIPNLKRSNLIVSLGPERKHPIRFLSSIRCLMTFAAVVLCLSLSSEADLLPALPTVSASTGGIKADIRDRRDAPVPGVRILLKHPDGRRWVTYTNEKGHFQAGGLPPGDYQLECRKETYSNAIDHQVRIKAHAWLLGVPPGAPELPGRGGPRIHLVGPQTYEYAPGLLVPATRQKVEKIPTH